MATPLSATAALAALRAEGLEVVGYDDWADHNRGQRGDGWGPMHGVVLHHTVTGGATPAATAASVALCATGYEDLPGPVCHGVIDKQGVVHLVGWGRANHAGLGDADVLAAVIAEKPLPPPRHLNTDGNARFYGFECINWGDNKDHWPAAQVEAMVRASAALCRAHGWGKQGKTSVIGHLEWQVGKPDPRGPGFPGMAMMRARVAERLTHPANWSPGDADPAADTYTVKDGDTLSKIAKAVGSTVAKLTKLNALKDPDVLTPGQKLKIK